MITTNFYILAENEGIHLIDKHFIILQYMKNLRETIRLEYKSLKRNALPNIDIDDMRAWRRHERKYKFLPTLERNATVSDIHSINYIKS